MALRRVLWTAAVLAALWSAVWFAAARSVERAAETWFAEAAADGLRSGYDHISVAGFPARLTLRVEAPRLSDPLRAVGWGAEGVHATAAVWSPRRVHFAPEGTQALTLGTTGVTLRSAAMEGVAHRQGAAQALELELRAVEAVAPDFAVSLAEGRAEARQSDAEVALRVALAGVDITGLDWPEDLAPRPDGPVARLDLDAAAGLGAAPIDAPRPVEWVELRTLDLAWDGVRLRGAGRMQITPDGLPEGRIDLEAEDWSPLVALAAALGLVDPEIAETWLRVFEAMAQAGPAPGVLSLPVVARDGWLSVGPLPLGRAPRLAIP